MKMAETVPTEVYENLKVEINRLKVLVNDLTLQIQSTGILHQQGKPADQFILKVDGGSRFVRVHDIVFIKAESNYARIHLVNGDSVLTSKTLKYWIEKSSTCFLVRVHRSYVVNISKMISFHSGVGLVQMEDGNTIPYSVNMRKNMEQIVNGHHSNEL